MQEKIKSTKEPLWTKYFILICIISLLSGMGLNMVNNSLSLFMDSIYGNTSRAGLLYAMFSCAAIVCRLVSGRMSDKLGRRAFTVIGLGLFIVGVVFFGLSRSLVLLIIARMLQGFGYGMSNTSINAAGADITPPSRMSQGVSLVTMGYYFSAAFAATLVLALIGDNENYSRLFFTIAVVLAVGIVLTLICNYEKDPLYIANLERSRAAKRAAEKDLEAYKGLSRIFEVRAIPFALIYVLLCTSYTILSTYLLLYAKRMGIDNPGLFFTLSAGITLASRLFSGSLADKYGPLPVIMFSVISGIGCFVLLLVSKTMVGYLAAGVCYGFINGICGPTCYATVIKCSPTNRKGSATATYFLSSDISYGAGSYIWALVIDNFGFQTAFCVSIGMLIVAIPLCYFVFNKRRLGRLGVTFGE